MSCENCKDFPIPVADLLEELKLRDELEIGPPYVHTSGGPDCDCPHCRLHALRTAREAATKPKYQEGQEVWVRAAVAKGPQTEGPSFFIRRDPNQTYQCSRPGDDPGCSHIAVHPDDIRTEEPPTIDEVFQPMKYTMEELVNISSACCEAILHRAKNAVREET